MSNEFDADLDGCRIANLEDIESVSFDESWSTANLEKGKAYKVEYTLTANSKDSMINVMPTSGTEITIDGFSVVEIEADKDVIRTNVPKGMSQSYHHILGKQRKKKRC